MSITEFTSHEINLVVGSKPKPPFVDAFDSFLIMQRMSFADVVSRNQKIIILNI
jgi:hypothetical protein